MPTPELSQPVTYRLPKGMLEKVEIIAKEAEKTRSWVVVRALRIYMQHEGQELLLIAKGNDGTEFDADEVMRRLRLIRENGKTN